MTKQPDPPRQLYTLIESARRRVVGDYDRNLLIGYAVLNSLVDFETRSHEPATQRQEETRRIHEGLERVVEDCKQHPVSGIIEDLKSNIDGYLRDHAHEFDHETPLPDDAPLLHLIVISMGPRLSSYPNLLKKRGGLLEDNVLVKGSPIRRESDVLSKDYERIKQYFVGEQT